MSWWQARRARKNLKKMGLDVGEAERYALSALEEAAQLRDELRKQESPTYVRLVDEINALSYEPVPARERYEASADLVREASLTDRERDDLLTQIEGVYREVLQARPYLQVLSGLTHIQSSDLPRTKKVELSMELLKSYNLPEPEEQDIAGQVRRIYKL